MKNLARYQKRRHGYTAPGTEVRQSAIDKLGLFARRDILRNTVVAAWGGRILTKREIEELPRTFSSNYALPVYPGFYIAETSARDLDTADFINHSCQPNCRIANLLVMITKRRIRAGEELTADFDSGPKVGRRTRCRCCSAKCRGIVYF